MTEKILDMSVFELQSALSSKQLSSAELTKAYVDNIEKREPEINAYLTLTTKEALKKAEEIDNKRHNNEKLSKFAGIPFGVKDNICTKSIKTTCASKMLENFIPPYNATVYEKLLKEDLIMLGKHNLDEFAMGSTTEKSFFKTTRNPININHVPGGSSGGSAASVAAGEAAFAVATDTGGSIRQPASFCGVVGMKPTYGVVSRYGLIAFASSLDQIGPITKNVRDSALILDVMAGYDAKDATSANRIYSQSFSEDIEKGVKGLKIGLPKEFFKEGISEDVKQNVLAAAKEYEKMGAEVFEISIDILSKAGPAYHVISAAEASSNLACFDGIGCGFRAEGDFDGINDLYKATRSEGFGEEVKRRIMLGTFVLSAGYYDTYYKKALQIKNLIIEEYKKIFQKCDIILSPVSPTTAYKINEKLSNPVEVYMDDIYNVPVNIAGLPSLSLPCGKANNGLPVGMQLIGNYFNEKTLYKAGNAFEQSKGVFKQM